MPFEDDDVVVSRVFERDDGDVLLLIHRPRPDPRPGETDPPHRCGYTLRFPEGEIRQSYAMGVDGMQSLLLAIGKAQVDLRYKNRGEHRPVVRWLGEENLGLTIPFYE